MSTVLILSLAAAGCAVVAATLCRWAVRSVERALSDLSIQLPAVL